MIPEVITTSSCKSSETSLSCMSVLPSEDAPDSTNTLKCYQCTDDSIQSATTWCVDCNCLLCDFHVTSHKRTRATQNHRLETQRLENRQVQQQQQHIQYCQIHPNEHIEVMCIDCAQMICFKCVIINHMQHNRVPISEVIQKQRKKVNDHVQTLNKYIEDLESCSQSIQNRVTTVDTLAKEIIKLIEAYRSTKVWNLLLQDSQLNSSIQTLQTRIVDLNNLSDYDLLKLDLSDCSVDSCSNNSLKQENDNLKSNEFDDLVSKLKTWFYIDEPEQVEVDEKQMVKPLEIDTTDSSDEKYEDLVLELVKHRGASALKYAYEDMLDDKEFIVKALSRGGSETFRYASDRIKSDSDTILFCMINHRNFEILRYISPDLANNREFILETIKRSRGQAIKYIPEKYRRDKELVIESAKLEISTLKYASEELLFNKEFILDILKINHRILDYIPRKWREHKDIIIQLLKHHGSIVFDSVFVAATSTLYDSTEYSKWITDRDVIAEAIRKNGTALMYASESLRSDRALVLKAVKKSDGTAMEYASNELKSDKNFVLSALELSRSLTVLQFASYEIRNNAQLISQIANEYSYHVLEYASDQLKNNRELMLSFIRNSNGLAIQYISQELLKDKDFVIETVRTSNGLAYKYLHNYCNDPDILEYLNQVKEPE
jgi:hypothetical protein